MRYHMTEKQIVAAFWKKVDCGKENECWPWTAYRMKGGYGRFRSRLATHFSLELAGHPRPKGAYALHSCDNPACVNPKHLRWGTFDENIAEAVDRGRYRRGEQRSDAKLTARDVRMVRRSTESTRIIAKRLGVSNQAVQNAKHHRSWKHVI